MHAGGSVTSAIFAACKAADVPTQDVEESEVAETLIWPFELISTAAETIARSARGIVNASAAGGHWPSLQHHALHSSSPPKPHAHTSRSSQDSGKHSPPKESRLSGSGAAPEQQQNRSRVSLPVIVGDDSAPTPDLSFSRRRSSSNGTGINTIAAAARAPVAGAVELDSDPPMGAASGNEVNPAATHGYYSPSLQAMLKQETVRHVRDAALHPTSPNAPPQIIPMAQSPVGHHPLQGNLFHTADANLGMFTQLDMSQQPASQSTASESEGVSDGLPHETRSSSNTPTGLENSALNTAQGVYRTAHSDKCGAQEVDTSSDEGADEIRELLCPDCTGSGFEHTYESHPDTTGSCLGGLASLPSVGLGPPLPMPGSAKSIYKTGTSSFSTALSSVPGGISRQSSARIITPTAASTQGGPMSPCSSPISTGGVSCGARRVNGPSLVGTSGTNYYYQLQQPSSTGSAVGTTPGKPGAMSTAMSTSMSMLPPDGDLSVGSATLGRQGQRLQHRLHHAGVRAPPSVLRTCFCLHPHVEESQELS